jgi:cytoskeletal protein CcmA (bactofilin family)
MSGESISPRQRIQLVCPECGHAQEEPAMVISTHCRACGSHFKVVDGKPVARVRTELRLAKSPPPEAEPPPPPKPLAPPQRPKSAGPKPLHPLLRLFLRPKPPRVVICFDCGHAFTAAPEAQSSQCPRCSCYVSLLDHEIDGPWDRELHTRGHITILKAGSYTATSLKAHDLTISGELRSPAECSGTVTIRHHTRLTEPLACRLLRVENHSRVEFLQPVTAERVVIDGKVRGRFLCTGTVVLRRRSHLHGYVRAAGIVVKSGAKHHGVFEPAPAPAP